MINCFTFLLSAFLLRRSHSRIYSSFAERKCHRAILNGVINGKIVTKGKLNGMKKEPLFLLFLCKIALRKPRFSGLWRSLFMLVRNRCR